MKKFKKIALSIQALVLTIGVTLPVHAANKVDTSNYYSNYYSNGSVVTLRTYAVPSKNNTVVKYNYISPYYWYYYNTPTIPTEKPSTPTTPAPTTPTKPQPTPTEPNNPQPTKPAPTPSTPAEKPASTQLSSQEQAMVDSINRERAANGLPALKVDLEVANVARIKANDMKTNNYFSHTSPTYGSPFDMLKKFGVSYRSAGENIAMNYSVDAAMTAFMNSSGHRANILNSNYTHVGVGIVGNYYVQMFISK